MNEEIKNEVRPTINEEIDYDVPDSLENPVPMWLKMTYIILPIWGLITGYIYINGTVGWLDRGYWHQLQIAANTTRPYKNHDLLINDEGKDLRNVAERKKASHPINTGISNQ